MKLRYGPLNKQTIAVYGAPAAGAPLVVLVHGGGWKTVTSLRVEAEELQAQGFAVFLPEYRLDSATVGAFPMEVEDVEAATRYSVAHAAEYNANAGNLEMVGGSAGGQLVGSAMEALNAATPGMVSSVTTLSGAFDFPTLLQDDREGKLQARFAEQVTLALGCSLETSCTTPEAEAWAARWSPARNVTTASCAGAWLMFNGTKELMPLDQPQAMSGALRTMGCPVTDETVATNRHAFQYWSLVKSQVVAFLRAN